MCGIVAYIGDRDAQPILLESLGRLEYRGYDSAGVAIMNGDINVRKCSGRISQLQDLVGRDPAQGTVGISHTRWATHGEPTDENAHPHLDQSNQLAVVHNGVVENFSLLRETLESEGHTLLSSTDTEVLTHWIGRAYTQSKLQGDDRLTDAVKRALVDVKGTYGIAVLHRDHPEVLVGARRGSPLILGVGDEENFLASDAHALVGYTQRVVYLKDYDVVTVSRANFTIDSLVGKSEFEITEIDQTTQDAELGDFEHYMLKEIFEQPAAIENAIRGRINREDFSAHLGGLDMKPSELREIDRVLVLGCGTALHAGMVGERMIESLAHMPVEIQHASEFRYANIPLDRRTLIFVVSQSGETADTLAALREARRKGHRCLGICNHVGSTIARETDGGVFMHAGPEIGVAATKSFTSQVTIFGLLAILLGRMRFLSVTQGQELISALDYLPEQVTRILRLSEEVEQVAKVYSHCRSMLFLGRQFNFPVALEGALKLKEISYIHAEGYPSAELKHGVIALVDKETPCVFIAPKDGLYEKNMSNIQEVKARGGPVIAIASEGDNEIQKVVDHVIRVPMTHELFQPILNVIPLQLLSYYVALDLGRDVDKPRNLAKSVTVE